MFIWIELQNNNQMKYGLKPFFQCCITLLTKKVHYIKLYDYMKHYIIKL